MRPKKRSIKKEEMASDGRRKKRRVEETPTGAEQKSKRSRDKQPYGENSVPNAALLFAHSNASAKVLQSGSARRAPEKSRS